MGRKIIFYLFLLCFVRTNYVYSQTQYFVSPNGKNTGKGSIDSPFLSIEKAKQEARKQNGVTTIYLREGVYRLEQPLILTSEDGNEEKQLVICAYPKEKVIITSGATLHPNWKYYKKNIMKFSVKESVIMDQLFVNGSYRPMTRYPNLDSTAVRFNGTSAQATSIERIKKWKAPQEGYLHVMHASDWGDVHYQIIGKDKNNILQLEGGWQNNRPSPGHVQNRMVENIFEELDAPGEWYYDPKNRILYYYPIPNENIEEVVLETPQLKHLVELRGSKERPVQNITIRDIEFTQTTRTFMEHYEPLLRSDWAIYRGGSILLEGSENCRIQDCNFYNLGGNAIFFSKYNYQSSVIGCHLSQIGASGICFAGDPEAVRSPSFRYEESIAIPQIDRTPGSKTDNYPIECLVYDNLIHHIGLYEKQVAGVQLSMCSSITISHNSIYHTPRAGINISEGTWGGHVIECNDVFDTVRETGDHGSFNSWGRDRFWRSNRSQMDSLVAVEPDIILLDAKKENIIRYNRFRCDRGWDIDLDDGSSNYHIYNNLCLGGGIKLREGFYRVVENNIIVNNTFHPHVWFKNSGDVFVRNLIMRPYRPIRVSNWGAETDYNLFTDSLSYQKAIRNHTDKHSVVYPVTFKNALIGDFSIVEISKITPLCGFKNFEMDKFGVVSPNLKQLAKHPQMPLPTIYAHKAKNIVTKSWSGLSLKELDSEEERSATGMDSKRGVYVIAVDALESPLRDFIQPNDVILSLAGNDIHTLADMIKYTKQADFTKVVEIIIFRNQKEKQILIPANVVYQSED